MTVIVPEPVVENSPVNTEQQQELKLDGGFVVPDNNAFGHSFRDYEKESERKDSVEQFYKTQHINQTFEFEEDLKRCQIQEWYPKFKSISIKTNIHELPETFVEYLLDDLGPFLLPQSISGEDVYLAESKKKEY